MKSRSSSSRTSKSIMLSTWLYFSNATFSLFLSSFYFTQFKSCIFDFYGDILRVCPLLFITIWFFEFCLSESSFGPVPPLKSLNENSSFLAGIPSLFLISIAYELLHDEFKDSAKIKFFFSISISLGNISWFWSEMVSEQFG